MPRSVSVEVDERLARFLDHVQQSRHLTPPEMSADLLRAGYHDLVRRLHQKYLAGEMTLRTMATELGLEYRELYSLLEELDLPVA